MKTPIIGRRILGFLGCDPGYMLMVARDKLEEDIVVTEKVEEDGNEEKMRV